MPCHAMPLPGPPVPPDIAALSEGGRSAPVWKPAARRASWEVIRISHSFGHSLAAAVRCRPFNARLEASGEESLLFQWVFLFLFAGEPAPLDVERPFERRQPRERISDRGDGAEE